MIPQAYQSLGVEPGDRRPVYAVLRIGKKHGQRGQPTDRGNFYVVEPFADQREFQRARGGTFKAPYRAEHPDFAEYNARKARTTFRGILPYGELRENWEVRRRAAALPGYPQHPNLFLTCESRDGETAERLYQVGDARRAEDFADDGAWAEGKPDDERWAIINCPGRLCEYAMSGECKTRAWLYFVANEPGLPRVLIRYQTGGQATTIQNIGAFFEDLDRMARAHGIALNNVSQIPFRLNLSVAVSRKHGRQMPVVSMAIDGTMTEVLVARRQDAEMGGGRILVDLLPESTETDSEPAKALDIIDAEPSKPGQATLFGNNESEAVSDDT